ncbi:MULTISPECIES: hypothetical protein [Acidithiobacillus]|uniref:hypothetical protein n=1 Tax=Acidithiobacillus TaxID=119977 RepID=UPI0011216E84|nr:MULTISPECIES: hypothetical protein [Acidithiobacillus]MDA8175717.1 hypothetical protein [Acidithiobacillus sp.]
MNETCSARPVGGFSVGPRDEYRPGPEPFRRDAGRVTATVQSAAKDKSDVPTGVVKLSQQKTHVGMIMDAVRDGHRSLTAIQGVTCFDRKKIRDITSKQVKAGNLVVDETASGEKIFSLPGEPIPDSAAKGSQDPDDVPTDVNAETEVDDDAGRHAEFFLLGKDVLKEREGSTERAGSEVDDALMFSENRDVGSTEVIKGIEMDEAETDLGYMHARLEHLYRTAQSSLGAFWESVVELRTMADDALQAKEKLLKVYEALGQAPVQIDRNGHGKGSHSDVQP